MTDGHETAQPWTCLEGVLAKLQRAVTHLEALQAEYEEFTRAPIGTRRDTGPTGETLFRLDLGTVPIELSVWVGDVLHQLRSALDHLAYGLVQESGGTPTRSTFFPILEKQKTIKIAGGDQLSPSVLEAVTQLQPFQDGDAASAHPLWVLNALVNVDKHRHLHLTEQFLADPQCLVDAGGALFGGLWVQSVIGDGDIVGVFDVVGGLAEDARAHVHGRRFLVFGDDGPWSQDWSIVAVLDDLLSYVIEVVLPTISPFLDRGH